MPSNGHRRRIGAAAVILVSGVALVAGCGSSGSTSDSGFTDEQKAAYLAADGKISGIKNVLVAAGKSLPGDTLSASHVQMAKARRVVVDKELNTYDSTLKEIRGQLSDGPCRDALDAYIADEDAERTIIDNALEAVEAGSAADARSHVEDYETVSTNAASTKNRDTFVSACGVPAP